MVPIFSKIPAWKGKGLKAEEIKKKDEGGPEGRTACANTIYLGAAHHQKKQARQPKR